MGMLEQRGQTWMLREGETYRKDVFEPERGDRLWHALGDRQILRGPGEKAARTCRGSWGSPQRKRKQGGRLRAREGRMKEPLAGKGVCPHQGSNARQHQRPTWDEPRNPDLEKTLVFSEHNLQRCSSALWKVNCLHLQTEPFRCHRKATAHLSILEAFEPPPLNTRFLTWSPQAHWGPGQTFEIHEFLLINLLIYSWLTMC